ncbi:MAG TPA: AgmX/PglI C-terminal domain-containing protein [Polyangiaceae bacterium]
MDVVEGSPRAPVRRVPHFVMPPVTVGPAVSVVVIRRVVRSRMEEMRRCYRSGLRRSPTLGGRVTLEIVVQPSGALQRVTIKSTTLADPAVTSCVAHAVGTLVFPRLSAGSLVIDYPLLFVP